MSHHAPDNRPLPRPAVDPAEYDRDYYLHSCIGSEQWRESEGKEAAGIYRYALERVQLVAGDRLLDIGTGRADLLPVALRLGASEAVGIDYSAAAIELARKTLAAHGNPPQARVFLADARGIPVSAEHFDVVTLLDVVEHLTPTELASTLAEAMRTLRPGGRVLVHTAPNALVYNVTYRLQRLLRPHRIRAWPRNPRNDFELRMHVNEQTPRSLRRVLRAAGFSGVEVELGGWVYTAFVPDEPARRLYHRLARSSMTRQFAIMDILAVGAKPTGRPESRAGGS